MIPNGNRDLALRWEPFGKSAELAKLGEVTIGQITPMSVRPGFWAYQVDGIYVRWIAKGYGQVKSKASARRAVARAWSAWCERAGLQTC